MARDLTAGTLRGLLRYEPDTGLFFWLVRRGGMRAGDVAGNVNAKGYVYIKVDGRLRAAHRLAWLYVHGCWPDGVVDHIDGVRANNHLANLRDVSVMVNNQNLKRASRANKLGVIGVCALKKSRRFVAAISHQNHILYLGLHDTPEQAHAAYLEAKRKLHQGCTI